MFRPHDVVKSVCWRGGKRLPTLALKLHSFILLSIWICVLDIFPRTDRTFGNFVIPYIHSGYIWSSHEKGSGRNFPSVSPKFRYCACRGYGRSLLIKGVRGWSQTILDAFYDRERWFLVSNEHTLVTRGHCWRCRRGGTAAYAFSTPRAVKWSCGQQRPSIGNRGTTTRGRRIAQNITACKAKCM